MVSSVSIAIVSELVFFFSLDNSDSELPKKKTPQIIALLFPQLQPRSPPYEDVVSTVSIVLTFDDSVCSEASHEKRWTINA